jgi:outer membrane receptor for ferrienterochelin and colicins
LAAENDDVMVVTASGYEQKLRGSRRQYLCYQSGGAQSRRNYTDLASGARSDVEGVDVNSMNGKTGAG